MEMKTPLCLPALAVLFAVMCPHCGMVGWHNRVSNQGNPLKADIWMPLYIGDYLADTIGLTHAQHGAYLLALMAYWRKHGPLSDSEAKGVMGEHADSLARFFTFNGGHWHHKRVERELKLADEMKEQRAEAGRRGMASRWGKRDNGAITELLQTDNKPITGGITKHNPSPSPSPSPSKPPSPPPSISPAALPRFTKPSLEEVKLAASKTGLPDVEAEKFWHFYESKGWLVGKAPMKSWSAAMGGWAARWRQNGSQSGQRCASSESDADILRQSLQ
jgi:uncharacterized protein YdaU (DUF1376 family)